MFVFATLCLRGEGGPDRAERQAHPHTDEREFFRRLERLWALVCADGGQPCTVRLRSEDEGRRCCGGAGLGCGGGCVLSFRLSLFFFFWFGGGSWCVGRRERGFIPILVRIGMLKERRQEG